jgi:hypothetical protein
VQGNKKRLTTIPTQKAHIGDVIFWTIVLRRALRENGTSITNHFPYQNTSFRLANQTNIPSVQAIIFTIFTLERETS